MTEEEFHQKYKLEVAPKGTGSTFSVIERKSGDTVFIINSAVTKYDISLIQQHQLITEEEMIDQISNTMKEFIYNTFGVE